MKDIALNLFVSILSELRFHVYSQLATYFKKISKYLNLLKTVKTKKLI